LSRYICNETNELRDEPKHLSRSDIFKRVEGLNVTFGKPLEPMDTSEMVQRKHVVEVVETEQWRKRLVFL